MSGITQSQLDEMKEVAQIIADIVAPAILKCIAAAQPGVTMLGDRMTTEPARDYRKEVWIAGFLAPQVRTDRDEYADALLEAFDKRFPK